MSAPAVSRMCVVVMPVVTARAAKTHRRHGGSAASSTRSEASLSVGYESFEPRDVLGAQREPEDVVEGRGQLAVGDVALLGRAIRPRRRQRPADELAQRVLVLAHDDRPRHERRPRPRRREVVRHDDVGEVLALVGEAVADEPRAVTALAQLPRAGADRGERVLPAALAPRDTVAVARERQRLEQPGPEPPAPPPPPP